MNRISSLVLVIHGTEDEVIDFAHGLAIHQNCQKTVDPLWVEGAGHNDIEIYSQYIDRLKRFINDEIRHHQHSIIMTSNSSSQQSQQPLNGNNSKNNSSNNNFTSITSLTTSTATAAAANTQTTQPTSNSLNTSIPK